MEFRITMHGAKEVQARLARLPKMTLKEVSKAEGNFLTFVQRSAKMRAPKFSGQLAESIEVYSEKQGEWRFIVDSPYGWFQEHGFNSNWLPAGLPVMGGYRIGDWMNAKGMNGEGIRPSGRPHPFVEPALAAGIKKLPDMLQRATEKAIKESK